MLGWGMVGLAALLGALLIGLSNGSEANVIPYVTGRYFGLKHYTQIYGMFFSFYCLGSGFGPPITAYLVEKAGGYHGMIYTHIGALILAGLVFLTFQRFPVSKSASSPSEEVQLAEKR